MSKSPPKLPPHDVETEAAALGVLIRAGGENCQAECDTLLAQLRPGLFYDLRHRSLLHELVEMRSGEHPHNIDLVTLSVWLRERGKLEECGGLLYVSDLITKGIGLSCWAGYLDILKGFALRRLMLAKAAELTLAADADGVTIDRARDVIADIYDASNKLGQSQKPLIQVWTVKDAQEYVPNPASYLVGKNVICKGQTSVIVGPGGVGKSRLARYLATCGARGSGSWMGYEISRSFRTFILQAEDHPGRLAEEAKEVDAGLCQNWVRWSLPTFLQFDNAAFRGELRRFWESWPFDLLVLDNFNHIAKADDREATMDGLQSIYRSLPTYPDMPAILLLTHFRKDRGGMEKRSKSGRDLLHEINGSMALGAVTRSAFTVTPATPDPTDYRVIFDCCKFNDFMPNPRSAWLRKTASFEPIPDFDWASFDNPADESRRIVTEQDMADVFDGGRRKLTLSRAKSALIEKGFGVSTAYRALDLEGKFADRLEESGDLIAWKP